MIGIQREPPDVINRVEADRRKGNLTKFMKGAMNLRDFKLTWNAFNAIIKTFLEENVSRRLNWLILHSRRIWLTSIRSHYCCNKDIFCIRGRDCTQTWQWQPTKIHVRRQFAERRHACKQSNYILWFRQILRVLREKSYILHQNQAIKTLLGQGIIACELWIYSSIFALS